MPSSSLNRVHYSPPDLLLRVQLRSLPCTFMTADEMAKASAANATAAKKALEKIAGKGKDMKKKAQKLAKKLRQKNKVTNLT